MKKAWKHIHIFLSPQPVFGSEALLITGVQLCLEQVSSDLYFLHQPTGAEESPPAAGSSPCTLHWPVTVHVPRWPQGPSFCLALSCVSPCSSPAQPARRQRCVIGCNSMYLATQMSHAGSCPKGRRTRTVNKDLGVLHFGAPAASLTLFTLNYSGSALSNYI